MSFWNGTQMWEKMLLVLAAAMLIVVVWGIIKLVRMKVQAKKDMERRAKEKENQGTAQLSKGDEIPFGIKALEAGIEVEGVVVSRSATPRSSFHNLSNLTFMGSDPRDSFSSLPSHTPSFVSPNPGPSQAVLPFDHNNRPSPIQPARYQPHQGNLNAPMPTFLVSGTARSGLPSDDLPGQKTIYTYNPAQHRTTPSPDTTGVLQISPPSRTPSRWPSPPEISQSLAEDNGIFPVSGSGSGSSHEEQSNIVVVRQSQWSSAEDYRLITDPRGDLSLLHSHRLSHAAEVGQLARRAPQQAAAASTHSLGAYSGSTHPASPSGYVIDLEQAAPSSGYHSQTPSEDTVSHAFLSPHEIDHNDVAYFEFPALHYTQNTTPDSSVMAREEMVDLELGLPQSKRASKKLTKKSHASS